MRMEIIKTTSRKKAIRLMPWAVIVLPLEFGYKGFESLQDYRNHISEARELYKLAKNYNPKSTAKE